MKRKVSSLNAPKPVGPYSQAIVAGDLVFCSGQIGIDPVSGELMEGIVEQTKRAIMNIEQVLKEVKLGLEDVVKTTVFMTDLDEFKSMNEVYSEFFKEPYPARTTVQVSSLPRGAKIEIEAIAVRT